MSRIRTRFEHVEKLIFTKKQSRPKTRAPVPYFFTKNKEKTLPQIIKKDDDLRRATANVSIPTIDRHSAYCVKAMLPDTKKIND